jgi:ectoine hydroxylase-related dioxygenase (phytanoyl-CoA dioxygenase family)
MDMLPFLEIDAAEQPCITDEQANFFRINGLLIIRNVLGAGELAALRDETQPLVDRAIALTPTREQFEKVSSENKGARIIALSSPDAPAEKDFFYQKHKLTGEPVPFRVEFVINKTKAGKALLGHPFILRSVEKLQGRNFIPTWDSVVFKKEGAGAEIPWHRDDDSAATHKSTTPIFNVDFYLDGSDPSNCLWGIPGSNRWTTEQANKKIMALNANGFKTDSSCAPIPLNPGDVIFHNIHALHGSPAAQSQLRRVVYFEFRPAEVEQQHGPHNPDYIPLKQKVLQACLRQRAKTSYAKDEMPFVYNPAAPFSAPALTADTETYRYDHADFWR